MIGVRLKKQRGSLWTASLLIIDGAQAESIGIFEDAPDSKKPQDEEPSDLSDAGELMEYGVSLMVDNEFVLIVALGAVK